MTYIIDPNEVGRLLEEGFALCPPRFSGNRKQRQAWCNGYCAGWLERDMAADAPTDDSPSKDSP